MAAGVVAWLLVMLGHRTFGSSAGFLAAGLFLVLGNPAIQRLSGVRVRAQCETFVALAVTAAMVILAGKDAGRRVHLVLAGVLLGLAFWLKYNAGIYVLPALALAAEPLRLAGRGVTGRGLLLRAQSTCEIRWPLGFAFVGVAFLGYFAAHGALADLGLATVSYNLQYSGETYDSFRGVLDYLTFPIDRAKLDLLWYLGGIGALVLLLTERRNLHAWVTIGWIAAACVSIAVNGARNLPQYFVQANPALALAAGAGWMPLVRRSTPALARLCLAGLLLAGMWKVGDERALFRLGGLPEAVRNTWFDLDYARGRVDRAWRTCVDFSSRRRQNTCPSPPKNSQHGSRPRPPRPIEFSCSASPRMCTSTHRVKARRGSSGAARSSWNSAAGGQVTDRPACCRIFDGRLRPSSPCRNTGTIQARGTSS